MQQRNRDAAGEMRGEAANMLAIEGKAPREIATSGNRSPLIIPTRHSNAIASANESMSDARYETIAAADTADEGADGPHVASARGRAKAAFAELGDVTPSTLDANAKGVKCATLVPRKHDARGARACVGAAAGTPQRDPSQRQFDGGARNVADPPIPHDSGLTAIARARGMAAMRSLQIGLILIGPLLASQLLDSARER